MAKPTEEQIRQRAQEIWEENHRPAGRDDGFWYQAEKELSQGTTSDEKSETFLDDFVAVDKNSPVRFGIGWVCENHPDRARDAELGCQCGAGMPCECNRRGEEPDVTQVIEEKPVTRH